MKFELQAFLRTNGRFSFSFFQCGFHDFPGAVLQLVHDINGVTGLQAFPKFLILRPYVKLEVHAAFRKIHFFGTGRSNADRTICRKFLNITLIVSGAKQNNIRVFRDIKSRLFDNVSYRVWLL